MSYHHVRATCSSIPSFWVASLRCGEQGGKLDSNLADYLEGLSSGVSQLKEACFEKSPRRAGAAATGLLLGLVCGLATSPCALLLL